MVSVSTFDMSSFFHKPFDWDGRRKRWHHNRGNIETNSGFQSLLPNLFKFKGASGQEK